jgi:hypothetical protein
MFNPETFAIVLDAVHDTVLLPDFSNRESVKAWGGELVGDAFDLVQNLGGKEKTQAALIELAATPQAVFAEHVHTYCASKCSAGANVERFGDGKIIDALKNINWQNVLQIISMFAAFFPKTTPAPQPTPPAPQESSGTEG